MVKKLVALGLASTLAVSLWSGVTGAGKNILKQIRSLETAYRAELRENDVETAPVPPLPLESQNAK